MRHYHKVLEEFYFILEGAGEIELTVKVESSAQAMRSSSLRACGTRSRLQSRCAFSVAAHRLMRTRMRIWNNRVRASFRPKLKKEPLQL